MAFIRSYICSVCGEGRLGPPATEDHLCHSCFSKKEAKFKKETLEKVREEYLNKLKTLTIEERLELLEAKQYDDKMKRKLSINEIYFK